MVIFWGLYRKLNLIVILFDNGCFLFFNFWLLRDWNLIMMFKFSVGALLLSDYFAAKIVELDPEIFVF